MNCTSFSILLSTRPRLRIMLPGLTSPSPLRITSLLSSTSIPLSTSLTSTHRPSRTWSALSTGRNSPKESKHSWKTMSSLHWISELLWSSTRSLVWSRVTISTRPKRCWNRQRIMLSSKIIVISDFLLPCQHTCSSKIRSLRRHSIAFSKMTRMMSEMSCWSLTYCSS